MERTTIYLAPDLRRRLKEEAAARGTTEAFLIREALASYLPERNARTLEPVGKSRDGGVAHEVDEALDELGFGRT